VKCGEMINVLPQSEWVYLAKFLGVDLAEVLEMEAHGLWLKVAERIEQNAVQRNRGWRGVSNDYGGGGRKRW
jgi:hypothetical protein